MANAQTGQGVFMYNYGVATPTIFESGSFIAFSNVAGTPPAGQSITFTASSMVGNVSWTDPDGIMEVSTDSSTWVTTASYTQVLGAASGKVWARTKGSTPPGVYNHNIVGSSSGAGSVSVPYNATVSSGTARRVIRVNFYDGNKAYAQYHAKGWNNFTPVATDFGGTMTSTSGFLIDTAGTTSTAKLTVSVGTTDNTTNGFFTDNGALYPNPASTSSYSDTAFATPYLFTGGAATSTDTLIWTGAPTPSSGTMGLDLISSRSTGVDRPVTFTVFGVTLPATGTFNARNNPNNLVGGKLPLHWDIPAATIAAAGGTIKIIMTYSGTFGFFNTTAIDFVP